MNKTISVSKANHSMDFTIDRYKRLLHVLLDKGYHFYTFLDYISGLELQKPFVLLRQDVEKRYRNALRIAEIQHSLHIRGTYYFRLFPNHNPDHIIRQIAEMGHETGYHYDDLSVCKGDYQKAIQRFEQNLARLRKIAPVKTIAMEGAPLSPHDNRNLWLQYNYRDFGLLGEPYFDLDFDQIFYLTDTGRCWNGYRSNMRDKPWQSPEYFTNQIQRIDPGSKPEQEDEALKSLLNRNPCLRMNYHKFEPPVAAVKHTSGSSGIESNKVAGAPPARRFRSTLHIIRAVESENFPEQVMINIHPQRWYDNPLLWMRELVWQNIKNFAKFILISLRN